MCETYKTYIFDLDGTLLNTLTDLAASCNYALKVNGLPEHTIEEVRMFVGNGVRKLMERAVPPNTDKHFFESILDIFKKHYLTHRLDTTQPYPGIINMLNRLKTQNKHIAVVSNKFDTATKELCKHFFGNIIDVAIGERDGIRKKPAPDTVKEALKQLGVDTYGTVYIGDSEVDIMTAKNCNIPCISVLWGFRDKDFLLKHGASKFVNSPDEIL